MANTLLTGVCPLLPTDTTSRTHWCTIPAALADYILWVSPNTIEPSGRLEAPFPLHLLKQATRKGQLSTTGKERTSTSPKPAVEKSTSPKRSKSPTLRNRITPWHKNTEPNTTQKDVPRQQIEFQPSHSKNHKYVQCTISFECSNP